MLLLLGRIEWYSGVTASLKARVLLASYSQWVLDLGRVLSLFTARLLKYYSSPIYITVASTKSIQSCNAFKVVLYSLIVDSVNNNFRDVSYEK